LALSEIELPDLTYLTYNLRMILSFSGGKDSSMALYYALREGYRITHLLTTVTEGYNRISIHGVRRELLRRQAKAIGIPLYEVSIPPSCTNEEYERRMREAMRVLAERDPDRIVIFGDIFLEDVRKYREERLMKGGWKGLFPLWGRDTGELAREFLRLGFKAVVVSVDGDVLSGDFVGREYDEDFLNDLPEGVDPCGERGEFHTFVYDGPVFSAPINFEVGEKVLRDNRFHYVDLVPKGL